ncbi:hypothetical protein EVG20_g3834 [Dentipellis fragilis]|uniref:HTH APSES-type domain-containing protein n=1 Tax=Dentipellis fragilis TaxID=205917 RepID=A0A4Y9Z1G1_9AGAM|nr:hypothetical protein EVG20_g3834 [Dentipellis fragilis]
MSGVPRPDLPYEHINPHIKSLTASNLPAVKFQEIIRDGQSTIVARMKVPTPTGHAFILRRLDTGAVSLTTMFRAAFPTASEEAEREESAWVKANFDLSGSNKSGKSRFAGTWVSASVAATLADAYSLTTILDPLTEAKPDPNTEYRKSQRAQQQTPDKNATPTKQLPTPVSVCDHAQSAETPQGGLAAEELDDACHKDPAPAPLPKTVTSPRAAKSPTKSPKLGLRRRLEPEATAGSDETAVDEDVAEIAGPDASQDIAEQKEMIAAFKAQREANRAQKDGEDVGMSSSDGEGEGAAKRAREEEDAPLQFKFKEPGAEAEAEERVIATNRRVKMNPQRKSLAWGVAAFAVAFGAMTMLPNPWF